MSRRRLAKLVQANKLVALAASPNKHEASVASRKACDVINEEKFLLIPSDLWLKLVARVMQANETKIIAPTVDSVYESVVRENEKTAKQEKPGFGRKKEVMSVRTYSTPEACQNAMHDHERAGYQIDKTHKENSYDEVKMVRGENSVIIRLERKVPAPPETKRGIDESGTSNRSAPSEHPQSRETD